MLPPQRVHAPGIVDQDNVALGNSILGNTTLSMHMSLT